MTKVINSINDLDGGNLTATDNNGITKKLGAELRQWSVSNGDDSSFIIIKKFDCGTFAWADENDSYTHFTEDLEATIDAYVGDSTNYQLIENLFEIYKSEGFEYKFEGFDITETTRIKNSPPTCSGDYNETFFYEKGDDIAIDSGGSIHQIHEATNLEDVEDSESWLAYGNEAKGFYTNYAEDGAWDNGRNSDKFSHQLALFFIWNK